MSSPDVGSMDHAAIMKTSLSRQAEPGRRILILNWRDVTHPRAGGAEKVTHEIARRWVNWGHQVTLFSAAYPGAAAHDILDGVKVIRRGSQQTVHWEAYRRYRQERHSDYDVILDEVNTIPFFAPLYARRPVIMFSHQLAREVWRYEAPFPLAIVGYLSEPLYLQAYRHTPVMTVSHSTRSDLRRLGLSGPCHVIPEAVDTRPFETLPSLCTKELDLTLAFVGRVVPSKRVDHMVRSLALIRGSVPQAHLWIIGAWDERYRRDLGRLISSLGLDAHVIFFGRVDEDQKDRLLARAHVVVMTSVREGWGLVVTEANRLGTPAVVYNVPGLRDSTRDGETGLVCKQNTPHALAQAVTTLHSQPILYAAIREGAWIAAKALNWERTACAAWDVVKTVLP